MKRLTVTFFGHRDTPNKIEPTLRSALIDLIENKNATVFYVGNNGNFDAMVRRQLTDLSTIYPIKYSVVLAYLPTAKSLVDRQEECTVLPEGIENVPKRFAINYRNKWMIDNSDIVVAYVTHPSSGSGKFKELAEKKNELLYLIP